MLELLLLLGLLEGVEPVGLLLSAGLLKELLPLLLPPLCLKLLPASFLSSLLLGDPGRLGSFTFALQLVVDHLGESLEVEGEEHLEGVGLPVVGEGGELGLGVLLEMARQGEELLVEGGLLRPGETLPRSGVGEGLETKLLVLELLCDGLPLPGGEHQLVSVAEVDVAQVGDQGLPLLAREPWWRRGGGGGGGRGGGGGGGGLWHRWHGGQGGEDGGAGGGNGGSGGHLSRAARHLGGLGEAGDGLLHGLGGAGGGDDGRGSGGDDLSGGGDLHRGLRGGGGGLNMERWGGVCGGGQQEGALKKLNSDISKKHFGDIELTYLGRNVGVLV